MPEPDDGSGLRWESVQTVARRLGYHDRTVRKWIAKGLVKAIRPGERDLRVQVMPDGSLVRRKQ